MGLILTGSDPTDQFLGPVALIGSWLARAERLLKFPVTFNRCLFPGPSFDHLHTMKSGGTRSAGSLQIFV